MCVSGHGEAGRGGEAALCRESWAALPRPSLCSVTFRVAEAGAVSAGRPSTRPCRWMQMSGGVLRAGSCPGIKAHVLPTSAELSLQETRKSGWPCGYMQMVRKSKDPSQAPPQAPQTPLEGVRPAVGHTRAGTRAWTVRFSGPGAEGGVGAPSMGADGPTPADVCRFGGWGCVAWGAGGSKAHEGRARPRLRRRRAVWGPHSVCLPLPPLGFAPGL